MFNILFHYPRVLARHRQGPSAQARERYLTHRADQGAARDTLLRTARELLVIAQRLDLTTDRMISIRQVEAAAERWVDYQQRRDRVRGLRGSRQYFIQTALSWLRFLGRLEAPDKKPLPFVGLVEHFAACMREQRGLSEVTIRNRCWQAQKFLNWLDGQNRSFREVSLQELDAFLSLQAAQGWGRVSVVTSAQALRSFFRHAEAHTWCAKGLAAGIDGPRVFKHEGLPMGPTWPDVERLIASTRGDRPREIRDYAILLLFALYAFRSGEVAALQLEDLHWDRELIVVARPKQRRAQEYPLTDCSGRRGVGRRVCSDRAFHPAGMSWRVLSPSWQLSLRDKFVSFQHVRDQATMRSQNDRRLLAEDPWPWCASSGAQLHVCVSAKGIDWNPSRDARSASTARRGR